MYAAHRGGGEKARATWQSILNGVIVLIMTSNDFDPLFSTDTAVGANAVPITQAKIRAWVRSPWLRDLVEVFGGGVSFDAPTAQLLAALEAFSDRWDFRRMARERGAASDDRQAQSGSARWLSAGTDIDPGSEARVMQNVERLGLTITSNPRRASYDAILVLGGARLSCYLRAVRAAELVQSGTRARTIGLLGAARPVADSERDATDTYAPGAQDEFDLAMAGGEKAFGFDRRHFDEQRFEDRETPNAGWFVRRGEVAYAGQDLHMVALAAPSSDPTRRRANSADTLVFFLDHEHIASGSLVLLITSQIYVPYVQLEALRTVGIPRQVTVETIGFPGRDRMPELQGMSGTNHYLQEVRSAIQAARRFYDAYPE